MILLMRPVWTWEPMPEESPHPMNTKPPVTQEDPPQPASADNLELRAVEIAKRDGRDSVTSQDREKAYKEMSETAQPNPTDQGEASH